MAGSSRFRVSSTCPSCKEQIVHECPPPAAPAALDALSAALNRAADLIDRSEKGSVDYRAGWRDALRFVADDVGASE